ncbi:MAG: HD family phosphohydrolase [Balneolaceae bacterium]
MSFLEKLGLGQKKTEGAPVIGKKKADEEKKAREKRNKLYRVFIFFVFLLITVMVLPESSFQPVASYTVGEPWRADDLTAPFTFSLKKTDAELQEEERQIRQQTPPVFHENTDAPMAIEARLDSLFRSLRPVIDSYVQWQMAIEDPSRSAQNDSIRYHRERAQAMADLDDNAWEALQTQVYQQMEEQRQTDLLNNLRTSLDLVLNSILREGVLNRSKRTIQQNEIVVRNLRDRTERSILLSNTRDVNEALDLAGFQLSRQFDPANTSVALQLFNQALMPNWQYSESNTEAMLQENLDNISRTKGAVAQGQVIIRRGDIVTAEQDNMLQSLASARASTASELERWLRYSGEVLIVIIASLLFLSYIFLYRRPIFNNPAMFLLVFLTLAIIIVASAAVYPLDQVNSYIVPIAIAPIILTIIFDSRVGLMATITLAIITAIIHDNNFEYLVATVAACSLGIFSVRDIKKRSQFFFTTPGVVFVIYFIVISGFALARYSGWGPLLDNTTYIAINSVFILFTYPLILLYEKAFKITTDFTLLELGDTNLPLLKELMTKAPGTFHHSLQVANLAESAASAIGANALLCRVGALYHDIGKMVKPSYFIENQNEENDHNKLKAKMSALVIKAHVSDGVKMAKKNNLPQVIIDFIRTHHGTSLIRFFYDKAQKNQEKESEIPEDDFRYDGPIPFTKEQGILLLADGVEAASRAMKSPNYNKLENLIDRMVDDHIKHGQLNHCPLTFRQIQIIKESFLSILMGVYHSRIEYPEEKDEKAKKKAAKKPAVEPSSDTQPLGEQNHQSNSEPSGEHDRKESNE